jgi:hypothetical protein
MICVVCGKTEEKHQWYSGPTCSTCYVRKNSKRARELAITRAGGLEAFRAKARERRKANPEAYKNYFKNWYKRDGNKDKVLANTSARCRGLKQRTPKWLSESQKQELVDIYTFRHPDYHVDHIIPLQGKDVCGLHVPWNLQYLRIEDNLKKGNKV